MALFVESDQFACLRLDLNTLNPALLGVGDAGEQKAEEEKCWRDVGTVVAYSLSRGWTVLMLHLLPEECKTNCGN
jgi:hypothetical protein